MGENLGIYLKVLISFYRPALTLFTLIRLKEDIPQTSLLIGVTTVAAPSNSCLHRIGQSPLQEV